MSFARNDGDWLVSFLDPRSKLPIGKQWVFNSSDVIRGLVTKSRTQLGAGPGRMFELAIREGKGQVTLELTGEQYIKLNGRKS